MNIIFIMALLLILGVFIVRKFVFDYKIESQNTHSSYFFDPTSKVIEGLTADEAVKNVASLYNVSKLTVTDLVSTGNATVNGTMNTGALYTKGNSGGWTHFPWTDGNNYITSNNNILRGGPTTIQGNLQVDGDVNIGATIKSGGRMHVNPGEILYLLPKNGVIVGKEWGGTGDLSVQGNLQVNGISNLKGTQAIVLDAPNWNVYNFREQITNGNYFNRNMPDGTTLRFMFVHPNRNAGSIWVWNALVVKLGNQFLIYQTTPVNHENIGNPWASGSNDLIWRGNIN